MPLPKVFVAKLPVQLLDSSCLSVVSSEICCQLNSSGARFAPGSWALYPLRFPTQLTLELWLIHHSEASKPVEPRVNTSYLF
ncbi:hypothetical protein CEXT_744371 [Caerostris extrusa]|uniref:Uncharacterized protein n=1 Tax=Caerostris extrusa TaxID=172846 RepID=A0AAV4TBB6_CAEEX|nr:hypothetical protein CEXT_744371 [Caerostris extrusa]